MNWKHFVMMLALVVSLAASAVWISQAQGPGGIRRESGFQLDDGLYFNFTAGAAMAANEAVYLDASGQVQKAPTSGQTTALIGIAKFACTSGQTDCLIQTWGKATAIADAAISVGARVGAPTTTAGRLLTVTDTLTVATGGTAVTSSAANGNIVNGEPAASIILGRALTSAAAAGNTFTVFVGLQ